MQVRQTQYGKAKTPHLQFSTKFKTQVALEALKETSTQAQLTSKYDVTPAQISAWKKQALESLPEVFGSFVVALEQEHNKLTDELYQKIGRLDLHWLQKTVRLARS